MIGTNDQSCWLAEACKILLLLLLREHILLSDTLRKVRIGLIVLSWHERKVAASLGGRSSNIFWQ